MRLGLCLNKLTEKSRRQALALPWSVIKVMDIWDEDFLGQIKAANPKCVIVGRHYYPKQDFDIGAALAPILNTSARVKQLVDYWETYNEVLSGDGSNAQAYAQYTVGIAQRLRDTGLKHCALSLADGTPAGNDDAIRRALDILWPGVETSAAWSYHGYGAPHATDSAAWLALRYRKYCQLDPRYLTRPLILTEFGIDYGLIAGQHGGWLAHGIPASQYAQELLSLNAEMAKDTTVLGATIYQAGDDAEPLSPTDSAGTWGSFCVTDALVQLIGAGMTVSPTPTPAQVPADPDLAYFGQYGHTPNADSALYKYGLLPLRKLYQELLAQNRVNLANEVNPGPCIGPEVQVVKNGVIHYTVKLTNRIIGVYCQNGQWLAYQEELFK